MTPEDKATYEIACYGLTSSNATDMMVAASARYELNVSAILEGVMINLILQGETDESLLNQIVASAALTAKGIQEHQTQTAQDASKKIVVPH